MCLMEESYFLLSYPNKFQAREVSLAAHPMATRGAEDRLRAQDLQAQKHVGAPRAQRNPPIGQIARHHGGVGRDSKAFGHRRV